jgi:RecA-family ATPase
MEDIARSMNVSLDRFDGLHLWPLAGKDAVLATADERNVVQPTSLWRELERRVAAIRPALVILDPLISLFPVNEIVRAQARGVISLLRGLAIKHNAAVVLSAHPSLSGTASGTGSSGSTDWGNAVRSRMFLERVKCNGSEPDERLRTLRVNKLNYGPKGGEIHLRWREGVFEIDGDDATNSAKEAAQEADDDVAFLDLVDSYAREGRPVAAQPGPTYAPAVFARDKRGGPRSKEILLTTMNRLLGAGRIRSEESGPPSKRRSRLVVCR